MASYRKTKIQPNDRLLIPDGLSAGSQVIVRGRVKENDARFAINLQAGESNDSDIAFHFNPRNDQGDVVVRNARVGGNWQNEERDTPFFPFNNGRKFTVRILVTLNHYKVLVNNSDFIVFNHRIPSSEVRSLWLAEGAEYYEASVQNNCRAPFVGYFSKGVKKGQAVRIRGFVKDDANQFTVNFCCDRDANTIGFHFNPRLYDNDTVLNAKIGDWGEEKRGFSEFPFQRGKYFEAFFIALEEKFYIYINEKFFTDFDYRCSCSDIHYLKVDGCVELMDVDLLHPLPNDFIKHIPSGLEKDDLIEVKGFFYPEGNSFAINLIKGSHAGDDIALHINPRRNEGEIVLNSRGGGNWEAEKRKSLPEAMTQMAPFEIEILAKKDKFKIYANQKKVAKFKARDDIEDIRAIFLSGEAYLYEVKLLRKLDLPFVDRLPGTLEPGNWVVITAAPDDKADKFVINLQCGSDDEDDIAFHFNPRFEEGVTVRNTKQSGVWGEEERHQPYFPFKPEDRVEIAFAVLANKIRVFVNKKHYVDYNFRIEPDRICHILLAGDCDFFEPEFF